MMIQEIAPHHLNITYQHIEAKKEDYLIIQKDHQYLLKVEEDQIIVPHIIEGKQYEYLVSLDDLHFFYSDDDLEEEIQKQLEEGYQYYTIRDIMFHVHREIAYTINVCSHIINWYHTRKYCGKCGHEMIHDQKERKVVCPHCNHQEYPSITPAVIVGIVYQDQILLSKYNHGKIYALIAGFCEVGETIEECVKREVKEETNLEVTHLHYYKSQPWSFSNSLLFGFYCEVKGDPTITVDHSELAMADFFNREEIPDQVHPGSLTAEMIMRFKEIGRDVFLD